MHCDDPGLTDLWLNFYLTNCFAVVLLDENYSLFHQKRIERRS